MIRYDVGDPSIATVGMAIPAVAIALLWLSVFVRRQFYRRYRGWRWLWETVGSTLLISLVVAGPFLWYLVWRPFQTIIVAPDREWTLGYVLPQRAVRLAESDIVAVTVQEEHLPFASRWSQPRRLVVTTAEGRTYIGAPMDSEGADQLMAQLRR